MRVLGLVVLVAASSLPASASALELRMAAPAAVGHTLPIEALRLDLLGARGAHEVASFYAVLYYVVAVGLGVGAVFGLIIGSVFALGSGELGFAVLAAGISGIAGVMSWVTFSRGRRFGDTLDKRKTEVQRQIEVFEARHGALEVSASHPLVRWSWSF